MITYGDITRILASLGFGGDSANMAHEIVAMRAIRPRVPVTALRIFPKLSRSVQDRIERLNPDGVEEGCAPRGMHRKFRWGFEYDTISPREFIAAHGAEAYRAVPRELWVRHGLRKAMRRVDYLDNVWKVT